jgi:uncharacterized membrane protein YhiD involved in acid resistance
MKEAAQRAAAGGGFELWQVLAALLLSFFLCLVVAYAYRATHKGMSYSVSFVHTMIMMGVTISIIMLIIGSNIARAFALVGALSIIRFRNAVKESRDVAFIFLTMAVGMASGTGFYLEAVTFTLFSCAMIYFLYRFDIGAMTARDVLLKVYVPGDVDYTTAFNQIFFEHTQNHSLLSVESVRDGQLLELVYSIQFKSGVNETRFLEAVRKIASNNRVTLLTGQDNVLV